MSLINGQPQATVPADDRGLNYGDGVFETLLLREGVPQLWPLHWARLQRGLHGLGISGITETLCLEDFAQYADIQCCMAKLVVTRGSGPRGYAPPTQVVPRRIVTVGAALSPTCTWPSEPLCLGVCQTPVQPSPLPGCKHLNRLDNVLARREWQPGWDEALMGNRAGEVICGTQSNVFMVLSNCVLTPQVTLYGIAGTRRAWVLEQLRTKGVWVQETVIRWEDLRQAQGLFLSNAGMGLREARWDSATGLVMQGGHENTLMVVMRRIAERLHEHA